jgi:hypothetical protein
MKERVELRRETDLRVRLVDQSGKILAERTLPGSDCAELARATAVLIGAWRTEVAAASPKLELKPPPPRPRPQWEVGGGFVASFAGSSFAAGGEVIAAVGGRRVLGRLAAFGLDLRALSIANNTQGQARFTRAGFQAGPMVRFRPGRWLLDVHAEATLALLYMDAVGFATNQAVYAFDLGLGAGARAALHWGPAAPFLSIGIIGWPMGQSVRVSGPAGGSAPLPVFEVLLATGIAFGNY